MSNLLKNIGRRKCPFCGSEMVRTSEYVDPISTRIWLTLSLQKPYRCEDCDERFYGLRFKKRVEKADSKKSAAA